MIMNANDLFKAVMQLDLEPIKTKLMHVQSGEGWSQDKANAVEKEYRRFLCLMKLYPDEDTAPLVDVDTFWHYHILDTMKYAVDCQAVFGYFLHHYPYVGMRGDDDEQFRLDSGDRMRELYESTFGEAYPGSDEAAAQDLSGQADASATAYCAGPRDKVSYCAGPRIQASAAALDGGAAAYCAGPRVRQLAHAAEGAVSATAYCAGPRIQAAENLNGAAAYCAGPRVRQLAHAAEGAVSATAYCAGPRIQASTKTLSGTATAYCAGPRVEASSTSAGRNN
jgi:hypothetical protein